MVVDFFAGAGASLLEAPWLPHLEFLAQTDERDVGRYAGMGAKHLRKHDASILVEREDVDVAIKRDGKLIPLVRIIRKVIKQRVDFLRKALAARIESCSVE